MPFGCIFAPLPYYARNVFLLTMPKITCIFINFPFCINAGRKKRGKNLALIETLYCSTIYLCYFELKSEIVIQKIPNILHNIPVRIFLIAFTINKLLILKIGQPVLRNQYILFSVEQIN